MSRAQRTFRRSVGCAISSRRMSPPAEGSAYSGRMATSIRAYNEPLSHGLAGRGQVTALLDGELFLKDPGQRLGIQLVLDLEPALLHVQGGFAIVDRERLLRADRTAVEL